MDELNILEITTGKTREIQVCNKNGEIIAICKYAKVSPVGHLIDALVKLIDNQITLYPPDLKTKISK